MKYNAGLLALLLLIGCSSNDDDGQVGQSPDDGDPILSDVDTSTDAAGTPGAVDPSGDTTTDQPAPDAGSSISQINADNYRSLLELGTTLVLDTLGGSLVQFQGAAESIAGTASVWREEGVPLPYSNTFDCPVGGTMAVDFDGEAGFLSVYSELALTFDACAGPTGSVDGSATYLGSQLDGDTGTVDLAFSNIAGALGQGAVTVRGTHGPFFDFDGPEFEAQEYREVVGEAALLLSGEGSFRLPDGVPENGGYFAQYAMTLTGAPYVTGEREDLTLTLRATAIDTDSNGSFDTEPVSQGSLELFAPDGSAVRLDSVATGTADLLRTDSEGTEFTETANWADFVP